MGFPGGSAVKNLPTMQELQEPQFQSLGREDSPARGHGNPLQYSCLENPMGRAWWAIGESHGHSLVGYSPWGFRAGRDSL